jgi:hypothetical protein
VGINDLELETETYLVRDGTWEGSPHGMHNAQSIVLCLALFDEAHHYPNGYLLDGIPVSLITATTGGGVVGQYGPFAPADPNSNGADVMAGVIVDNPRVFKSDGTLKTAVFTAMPKHCVVKLANLPAAGVDVAGTYTVVASDLPTGYKAI